MIPILADDALGVVTAPTTTVEVLIAASIALSSAHAPRHLHGDCGRTPSGPEATLPRLHS